MNFPDCSETDSSPLIQDSWGHLHTLQTSDLVIKLLYMNKRVTFRATDHRAGWTQQLLWELEEFLQRVKKKTFNQSEISLQRLFKGRHVFFLKLRLLFTHLRRRTTKFWSNQAESELDFSFSSHLYSRFLLKRFSFFWFLPLHLQFVSFFCFSYRRL